MSSDKNREELLNVELARLLAKRGLITLPERVLKTSSGKRQPDVLIGIFNGIRINIEGKFDSTSGRKIVEKQCKGRIDEHVASMSIAVCYRPELANEEQGLVKKLEASKFAIKIFAVDGKNSPVKLGRDWYDDTSKTGFEECDIGGITKIIKNCHQELIAEDTVQKNVKLIENVIEDGVSKVKHQAPTDRVNQIITTAFDGSSEEDKDG